MMKLVVVCFGKNAFTLVLIGVGFGSAIVGFLVGYKIAFNEHKRYVKKGENLLNLLP